MERDARPDTLRDVVTSRVPSLIIVGTIFVITDLDNSFVLIAVPLLYNVST